MYILLQLFVKKSAHLFYCLDYISNTDTPTKIMTGVSFSKLNSAQWKPFIARNKFRFFCNWRIVVVTIIYYELTIRVTIVNTS